VGKPGQLRRGSLSAPCRVVNVSENGMRIQSRLFVKNGDALYLSIELEGGAGLNCQIQVINVRPPAFWRRDHVDHFRRQGAIVPYSGRSFAEQLFTRLKERICLNTSQ